MGIWEHTREVGCRAGGRWDFRSPDQAGCRDRFQQRFLDPPTPHSSGKTWSHLKMRLVTGGGDAVYTHHLFVK